MYFWGILIYGNPHMIKQHQWLIRRLWESSPTMFWSMKLIHQLHRSSMTARTQRGRWEGEVALTLWTAMWSLSQFPSNKASIRRGWFSSTKWCKPWFDDSIMQRSHPSRSLIFCQSSRCSERLRWFEVKLTHTASVLMPLLPCQWNNAKQNFSQVFRLALCKLD